MRSLARMAFASMSEVMRLELTRFWTNPSLVVALFAQACLICGGACLIIFVVLQSFRFTSHDYLDYQDFGGSVVGDFKTKKLAAIATALLSPSPGHKCLPSSCLALTTTTKKEPPPTTTTNHPNPETTNEEEIEIAEGQEGAKQKMHQEPTKINVATQHTIHTRKNLKCSIWVGVPLPPPPPLPLPPPLPHPLPLRRITNTNNMHLFVLVQMPISRVSTTTKQTKFYPITINFYPPKTPKHMAPTRA